MSPADKRAVLDWLSPINFLSEHEEALSQAFEDSYKWVTESGAWKEWISGRKQTIWLHGPPGCGKTVACSVLIEILSEAISSSESSGPGPEALAYCYCHPFTPGSKIQPLFVIRNILKQLYQALPVDAKSGNTFRSDMIRTYKSRLTSLRKPPPIALRQCLQALASISGYFSRVYIVLDALDFCSDPHELLSYLGQFQKEDKNVFLLITSRHKDSGAEYFREQVKLQLQASEGDILKYVAHTMHNHPNLLRIIQRQPTLATEITDSIIQGAHGVFMLPRLQMKQLCNQYCPRGVQDLLKGPEFMLPEEMSSFLDGVIQEIQAQPQERALLATKVLAWILYAKTSLTVSELQHALATREGDDCFEFNGAPDLCDIISVCGGLVTVEVIGTGPNAITMFRFCHPTMLQKYFQKNPGILSAAQRTFPIACLAYLKIAFIEVSSKHSPDIADTTEATAVSMDSLATLKVTYPWLAYACKFWAVHARENVDSSFWDVVSRFFLDNPRGIWASILIGDHTASIPDFKLGKEAQMNISPIYMAALFNFPSVLDIFRKNREYQSFLTPSTDGNTLCSWAAFNDHLDIVKCLVAGEVDLDLDRVGITGKSALFHAVEQKSRRVLEFFHQLQHQGFTLNPNLANLAGETPITAAVKNRDTICIRILIKDFGVHVDTQDAIGATPVYYAAMQGFTDIVRFLFKLGADLQLVTKQDESPLSVAITGGHEETVTSILEQIVLKEGAAKIIKNALKRCILAAAKQNNTTMLRHIFQIREQWEDRVPMLFLWDLVHAPDVAGRSPLSYAAEIGNKEVAEELLKQEVNIDVLDTGKHWSPLHYAVLHGNIEVLRVMLARVSRLYFITPPGSERKPKLDTWGTHWIPRDGEDSRTQIPTLVRNMAVLIEGPAFIREQKSRQLSRHPEGIVPCAELFQEVLPQSGAVVTLLTDILHHLVLEIMWNDYWVNQRVENILSRVRWGPNRESLVEEKRRSVEIQTMYCKEGKLDIWINANGYRGHFDLQ